MKLREFNEEDLMRAVNDIHLMSSVKKSSDFLSGRIVFYVDDYFDRESGYNNTTVKDILELYDGKFNFSVIGKFDATDTVQYVNVKIANKKDFRGILKFTPKETLCLSVGTLGKKGYDGSQFYVFKLPILQKEEILHIGEVDDVKQITEYYRLLTNNKALVSNKNYILDKEKEDHEILITHLLINNYYEILNSWHIAYDYEDCTYLIPVDIDDLKNALKNRDKTQNGRKPILPTIVNSFSKANNTEVKTHTRMSDNGFELFGEHFYFLMGRDAIELTYGDGKYGKNKLQKSIRNGKSYTYRENETLVLNEKGVGIAAVNLESEG